MKRFLSILFLLVLFVSVLPVPCPTAFAEEAEPTAAAAAGYPAYWTYDVKLVKKVQKALNTNGAKIKVTGVFDAATGKAVKQFQLKNKLAVTGVVDEAVAKKLGVKSWPKGGTMYYMANLAGVKAGKGKLVVYIALGGRSGRPRFAVFKDGKLVAECGCIAGNQAKGKFTPLGMHTVSGVSKSRKTAAGNVKKDLVYLKVNKKATSYAIHSLLYKPDGKLVAGQKLGTLKTDGSIRVPAELAKWLRAHSSQIAKIVVDDRAYSPASVGYKTLIKTK